jgi:hypothetical protein
MSEMVSIANIARKLQFLLLFRASCIRILIRRNTLLKVSIILLIFPLTPRLLKILWFSGFHRMNFRGLRRDYGIVGR